MSAPKWPPTITHHRPSGQARVRYRGRDYYLGPFGSAEARKAYVDLLHALADQSPPPSPSGPSAVRRWTVAEAVARWFSEQGPTYDPEGRQVEVVEHAVGPLLRVCARLSCDQFDADQLELVREDMIARDWALSLIQDRLGRIRSLFRWFERKKMAPPGTWSALAALGPLRANDPRVRRAPRRRACTWEELAAVCQYAPASVRGVLLVMYWAGARTGEARRMRGLEIEQAGDVWLWRPGQHKTRHLGHERIIPLGPNAQAVVGPRLADRPPEEHLWPAIFGGGPHSQRTRGPRCYSKHSLGKAVRRARIRAGVPGFQPYQCRHAARLRVGRSDGLEAARAFLGHSRPETTLEYATQRDLPLAVDAARRHG